MTVRKGDVCFGSIFDTDQAATKLRIHSATLELFSYVNNLCSTTEMPPATPQESDKHLRLL